MAEVLNSQIQQKPTVRTQVVQNRRSIGYLCVPDGFTNGISVNVSPVCGPRYKTGATD